MKKSILKILAVVVLMLSGCSKDEPSSIFGENNQLKKGRIVSSTIEFYSASTETTTLPLIEVGGQIMKYGEFSGHLNGYGEINPSLSKYEFAEPLPLPNLLAVDPIECSHSYFLSFVVGTARIVLAPTRTSRKSTTTISDYCIIEITQGPNSCNLWPLKWGPDSQYKEDYFGGNFIGTAKIIEASGKLELLLNKTFRVEKFTNMYAINLTTGYIKLHFTDYLAP